MVTMQKTGEYLRPAFGMALLLTLFSGACAVQAGELPVKLKMVLNPTKKKSSTLIFNTENGQITKEVKRKNVRAVVVQDSGAVETVVKRKIVRVKPKPVAKKGVSEQAEPVEEQVAVQDPDVVETVMEKKIVTVTSRLVTPKAEPAQVDAVEEKVVEQETVIAETMNPVSPQAPPQRRDEPLQLEIITEEVVVPADESIVNDEHVVKSATIEQPVQEQQVDAVFEEELPQQEQMQVSLRENPVQPKVKVKKRPEYIGYTPKISLTAGYRQDELQWDIGGIDGKNSNILSELTWKDVKSYEIATNFKWSNSSKLYFRGGFGFGWIYEGTNQDSDYKGDNRTMEYSRSYSDTSSGTLWDGGLGAGYRFDFPLSSSDGRLQFMPMVGYSYHVQEFEDTNGRQVVSEYGNNMPLGHFSGLQSYYDAKWQGPWLGFDVEFGFNRKHSLEGSFEYHWADYTADANWNLRSDFAHPVSFSHESDGTGIIASLNYRYAPSETWDWTVGFTYRDFEAERGKNTFHLADGRDQKLQPLNGAEWSSYTLFIGFGYYF